MNQKISHSFKFQCLATIIFLVMITLTWSPVQGPDWDRFEGQAISILNGFGFQTYGVPETKLPPGYPLLVTFVYWLNGNDKVVLLIQTLLLLAACNFFYMALKPYNNRIAQICTLALVINPFIARYSSHFLSEALGIFLCCLLLYFFSKTCRKNASSFDAFMFGAVAIALPLTSPATIIMAFICGVYALAKTQKGKLVLAIMAGVMVLLTPWQIHCMKVTGSICPALYSSEILQKKTVWYPWFRSWATTTSDLHYFWHLEDIHLAPNKAFTSSAQRSQIIAAQREGGLSSEKIVEDTAIERIESDTFRFYVELPIIRSGNLWFDMNQLSHIQMEYVGRLLPTDFLQDTKSVGTTRAMMRYGKSLLSTIVYIIHITIPLLAISILFYSSKNRNIFPVVIIFSILIYTFISGYTAHIEARRNLVFIPMIYFLVAWLNPLSGNTNISSKS